MTEYWVRMIGTSWAMSLESALEIGRPNSTRPYDKGRGGFRCVLLSRKSRA